MDLIAKIESLINRGMDIQEVADILSISLDTVSEVSQNQSIQSLRELPLKRDETVIDEDRSKYKEALDRFALGATGTNKDQLAALKIVYDTFKVANRTELATAISKHPIDNRKTVINFNMKIAQSTTPKTGRPNIPKIITIA